MSPFAGSNPNPNPNPPSPNHLSKKLLWMTSPTVQSNEDELSLDWLHVHHFVIQNCHFDYPFAI